jgi:hypothetical protein
MSIRGAGTPKVAMGTACARGGQNGWKSVTGPRRHSGFCKTSAWRRDGLPPPLTRSRRSSSHKVVARAIQIRWVGSDDRYQEYDNNRRRWWRQQSQLVATPHPLLAHGALEYCDCTFGVNNYRPSGSIRIAST